MNTPTQMWLVLVVGLALGYSGGVATMMHIRGREGGKQTAESPKLIVAKKQLAALRDTFTDESVLVQAQLQDLRQLEDQQEEKQAKALNDRSTWIDGPPASPRSGQSF